MSLREYGLAVFHLPFIHDPVSVQLTLSASTCLHAAGHWQSKKKCSPGLKRFTVRGRWWRRTRGPSTPPLSFSSPASDTGLCWRFLDWPSPSTWELTFFWTSHVDVLTQLGSCPLRLSSVFGLSYQQQRPSVQELFPIPPFPPVPAPRTMPDMW